MEFVKEFSTFLHENGAIKFGDFTLSSGKKSSYYIDLRIVPSFPHQFRKMIKHLQNEISENIGLDNFDYLVSVPTSGLVIASALATETVKPLIYVRNKPKDYGTSKSIEGHFESGKKALMIDDVATTGGSVISALKSLKDAGIVITDAFVIVNRMEGADKALESEGVKMHDLANILEITNSLHEQNLISDAVLNSVKKQIG
ncbi:MAG TPA: orotate phosphoribosyltransferase [Nitrosopumilaceae archaeon]|nr:orotate phosphoribosyltransferase [Nitrosopumilaceae archaeon]